MKTLRKVKWENITFLVMIILDIISIIHHIKLNGLYFNLIFEVIIYLMFAFTFRYVVKDIRKNPSNWEL